MLGISPTREKTLIFADNAIYLDVRCENGTFSLQDEIEHIHERMAMKKLSQNISKYALDRFITLKDDNLVFKKTETTVTEIHQKFGFHIR